MRMRRGGLLSVGAVVVAGLAAAPGAQGDAGASATGGAAKASCTAEKRALQRAPAKRKPQARKRYRACQEKALGAEIRRQLADRRLKGQRGDGSFEDWLLCANGKYRLASEDRSGRGISEGTRWVVTQAKGSATRWTAIIRETTNLRAAGLNVGVARNGAQYFVGIARGFGEVTSQGPVTLTPDAEGCAAL
jgi:hypothetical protein